MSERILEFRDALREAMSQEMRRDERVFLLGEEVAQYDGAYKVSRGMLEEFGPRRIIDTPISESGFAGLAIGAAMKGLRPIVEFMSWSFSLVAADPILNNAPKMLYMSGGQFGCPIVFRGNDGAGGQLGSTHSWCVEGMFSNVPGLKMAIPAFPEDAKGLLATAIRDDDPVFFLESERLLALKGHVPEGEHLVPFGQAIVRRPGDDVTIVSFGRPVHFCLEAAEALEEYESILGHEGFIRLEGQSEVHADAASAALATGNIDRCIELADLALASDRGSPAAALHKARALVERGDHSGAEAALRDADTTRTNGHQLARFHVGAARVYLEVGRERLAVNELVNAREADPFWAVGALETARSRMRVDDLTGAIDLIESVAYLDGTLEASRGPLHDIWYPPSDWSGLKREMQEGVLADVRFASRGAGVIGVISWAGGMRTAKRDLENAVRNSNEVPAAHAALSQLMLASGDLDGARFHARELQGLLVSGLSINGAAASHVG